MNVSLPGVLLEYREMAIVDVLGCALRLPFASVRTPLVNALNASYPHLTQCSLLSKNQWRHAASRELQAYVSNTTTPATHIGNCQRADARAHSDCAFNSSALRCAKAEIFRCLSLRC
uniref:Uncharacterized protein n=1 Tax=Parascaris univalens TaxID=6257 RepID=A0A915BFJ3_PARUN